MQRRQLAGGFWRWLAGSGLGHFRSGEFLVPSPELDIV